jgi:hypothetical protein
MCINCNTTNTYKNLDINNKIYTRCGCSFSHSNLIGNTLTKQTCEHLQRVDEYYRLCHLVNNTEIYNYDVCMSIVHMITLEWR